MLFNSYIYLLFLPVVVLLYYLTPHKHRWVLLFGASCYFYMYFIPKYILILFLLILIDYTAAIWIHASEGKRKKYLLWLSLAANIGLLAFFKYLYFADDILKQLSQLTGISYSAKLPEIVLPIGLSFHTFQSMAYTIEVYRGNQQPERHLGIYSVYVLFFPQMVAGPIERFATLGNQLKQNHVFSTLSIQHGLRLILFGFFIKMAVADQIAPLVDEAYKQVSKLSAAGAWQTLFLFSFQIYADFFGYSTIALGSARLLGINLIDNFRAPYLSAHIGEFWSRWHISLSTWFRDYLYIPLGGNKGSNTRWYLNIMVVFSISGLWHGANYTFIIWGGIHALLYFMFRLIPISKWSEKNSFIKVTSILFTFVSVSVAWVFFRAANWKEATTMLGQLIDTSGNHSPAVPYSLLITLLLFISADLWLRGKRFNEQIDALPMPLRWFIYAMLLFCIIVFCGNTEQPFIYFQF